MSGGFEVSVPALRQHAADLTRISEHLGLAAQAGTQEALDFRAYGLLGFPLAEALYVVEGAYLGAIAVAVDSENDAAARITAVADDYANTDADHAAHFNSLAL